MARFAIPFILLSTTGIILAGITNTILIYFRVNISSSVISTIYYLLINSFIFTGLIELQLRKNSAARKILLSFNCNTDKKLHPARVDALGRNFIEFGKEEVGHIYFDQLRKAW